MDPSTILGYLGGGILCVQSVPQVIKVWRSRSAKDISYISLLTYLIGGSLTIAYGVLIGQPPIYATLAFSMTTVSTLLCSKVYFERYENQNKAILVV